MVILNARPFNSLIIRVVGFHHRNVAAVCHNFLFQKSSHVGMWECGHVFADLAPASLTAMAVVSQPDFDYKQVTLPGRAYRHRSTGAFDHKYVDQLLKQKPADLMFLHWGQAEAIADDCVSLTAAAAGEPSENVRLSNMYLYRCISLAFQDFIYMYILNGFFISKILSLCFSSKMICPWSFRSGSEGCAKHACAYVCVSALLYIYIYM